MQYKFDFITSTVVQALMGLYDYFVIAVILWKFRTVFSWNVYEIGLLYAISRIGWGLYRLFCEEIERFENYIVRGDFDSILIRPWPSLYVLLSRNIDLTRLGWLVQGLGVGAISASALLRAGALSWAGVGHLVIASVSTGFLFLAVGLATASAAFKIVRIEELQVFTENASSTATLYPLDIYPGWLKRLLLWVIPLGAGNYVPVRYLLGKGGTWLNLAVPPVAATVSLFVALRLWHLGESRYHSTGS
jgi:ABC-2 type transport system permease protein